MDTILEIKATGPFEWCKIDMTRWVNPFSLSLFPTHFANIGLSSDSTNHFILLSHNGTDDQTKFAPIRFFL